MYPGYGAELIIEVIMEEKKDIRMKKNCLTAWTKYLLDFMFYAGIAVTVTLPFSIRKIGEQFPYMVEHYEESVIIYFVLGVAAVVLVRELRKIFRTVLEGDCFVQENVISLQKMGNLSVYWNSGLNLWMKPPKNIMQLQLLRKK